MKKSLKLSILPLLLIAFSTQTYAQQRSSNRSTKTVTTTTNKGRSNKIAKEKVVYKKSQKKVETYRTLPNKTVVKNNSHEYYISNNKYYTYTGGRYVKTVPRPGVRISTLPRGYVTVKVNNKSYFNFEGIFYINTGNTYEVVEPEIGTIVYELPSGYERVEIDGMTYYEYANVLYEKVQVNGSRAYEVVGIIEL